MKKTTLTIRVGLWGLAVVGLLIQWVALTVICLLAVGVLYYFKR